MKKDLKADVLNILVLFAKSKKVIAFFLIAFLAFGILYSLTIPDRYSVTIKLLPLTEQAQSSGLSSLASIAGIDFQSNQTSGQLSPILYPTIASSTEFLDSLAKQKLYFQEENEFYNYYEYVDLVEKKDLFGRLKNIFTSSTRFLIQLVSKEYEESAKNTNTTNYLSRFQKKALMNLNKNSQFQVDEELGLVSLTFSIQDKNAALELTQNAEDLLEHKVIEYRIMRAKENLNFSRELYYEKKSNMDSIKLLLDEFKDRNINITTSIARAKLQDLETQYSIASNVFSEVAKQVEQNKIQVSKDTPSFAIIDNARLPTDKANMRKWKVILISILAGFILSLIYILASKVLSEFKMELARL